MKTFLVKVTTKDVWEVCPTSYIVVDESEFEVKQNFRFDQGENEIESIVELDLSKKTTILVQEFIVQEFIVE